jgi:hypothetical protein
MAWWGSPVSLERLRASGTLLVARAAIAAVLVVPPGSFDVETWTVRPKTDEPLTHPSVGTLR